MLLIIPSVFYKISFTQRPCLIGFAFAVQFILVFRGIHWSAAACVVARLVDGFYKQNCVSDYVRDLLHWLQDSIGAVALELQCGPWISQFVWRQQLCCLLL